MESGRYRGKVSVFVRDGALNVQFRVQTIEGRSRQLQRGLGLPDTPENLKRAEAIATLIEADLKSGNLDPTLARYLGKAPLIAIDGGKAKKIDLLDLWSAYTEVKKSQGLAATTLSKFEATARRIMRLKSQSLDLSQGQQLIDYILEFFSHGAARELLKDLNACFRWALKSNRVTSNPFEGSVSQVNRPPKSKEDEIDPFSREERDRIIAAFEGDTREGQNFSHYAPLVKFLFFTGCRPSEAFALLWENIGDRQIIFDAAIVLPAYSQKLIRKEGLKTQERRKFPINNQLREILNSIPGGHHPESLVFPSPRGGYIDRKNFRNRAWKTILDSLPGIRYRPPYQCRHTFITLALDSGLDAKDVARLVGNSPEIIYQHYAGNKHDLDVPEL